MTEDYVEDIYSGLKNSKFVLFLGAGFSAPLGYPTGKNLSEKLAIKFTQNPEELKGKKLEEVVEYLLEKNVKRSEIVDYIQKIYSEKKESNGDNPYLLLKLLLEKSNERIIIFTTNWDRSIDDVFKGQAEIISTEEQINQLLGKKESPKITVFKLHGDIGDENVEESLVLTKEDIEKSKEMRVLLYDKFIGSLVDSRLLIIGYSMGDSDILEIYEHIRKNTEGKVDYLVNPSLSQEEISEIEKRFPSLNILRNYDAVSFLKSLLNSGNMTFPQFNISLNIDNSIRDTSKKGKIIVTGTRKCGKTYTYRRLAMDNILKDFAVVDIPNPNVSSEEDYKLLKGSVKNNKVAIFIPHYYLDYYRKKFNNENKGKNKDLFDGFTEIDHTINKDEAKRIFLEFIENQHLKEILQNHKIVEKILKLSVHSDKKNYSTYLPSLLMEYANKIENNKNLVDSIVKSKNPNLDLSLQKNLKEVIGKELEKEEKEIIEQDKHRQGIYAIFGLEAPWIPEEVARILEKGTMGFNELLKNTGLSAALAVVVPALGWISLGVLGIGVLLGLYERHKNKKKDILSFLIGAKEHWNEMSEVQKEMFAYDIERKNNLPPGSVFPFLSSLFETGKVEDLGKATEKYLKDHPDLFESVIEKSKAWENLQDNLKKQNTTIDEIIKEFDAYREKIEKEIERIEKDINEIENRLQEIEKEIKDLEERIYKLEESRYANGSEEIHNEDELRKKFSVPVPEKSFVGLGKSTTDEKVMSYANGIINKSSNNLVLITGDPGVGKSTMLFLVGITLLKQGKKLFYITDLSKFGFDDFSKFAEDSYAIVDVDRREVAEKIVERLNKDFPGNPHFSRIIIAVRTAYINAYISDLRDRINILEYPLNYSQEVLKEIVLREINSEIPNLTLTEEEINKIVKKSEGVTLYISMAIKKIKFSIENTGKFDKKILDELPEGIGAITLNILDEETEREKLLLLVYYLVSHYPNFPEEFLSSAKDLFGIPKPRYVVEVPGKQSFTLHSWYRDMTDWIIQQNYKMLNFGDAQVDKDAFVEKVEEVQTSTFLIDKAITRKYIDSIRKTLSKKEVLKSLKQKIKYFINHLGGAVLLIDLADAMMLFLIFHASETKLKNANTGYGFMINKERIDFKKLDKKSYQFYNKLVGFLVNSYLNMKNLKEEEIDKRPFYTLSILYISRLLAGDFIEKIDEQFLGEAEPSSNLRDISENYSNSPQPLKLYLSAFVSFLESIGYIKPQSEFEKGLLFYCKGMFKEAIQKYEVSIELDPNDPLYHNNKGLALVELKEYGKAIKEFKIAIKRDPNNPIYHNNKGVALKELKKFKTAIEEFDKAIELDPNDPLYHNNKGLALVELKEYGKAIKEFDKAIELDPNDPLYHNNKDFVLRKLNKLKRQIKSVLRILDLSPGDPDYLITYAELETDLDSPEEGVSKISDLIASGVTNRSELCEEIYNELKKEDLNEKEKKALLKIKKIICLNERNYKNG